MKNKKLKTAFSLIELSIVILIVGIIIAGVTQSSRLVSAFRLSSARNATQSSAVTGVKDIAVWFESTSENTFATGSSGTYVDQSTLDDTNQIARWNDRNPQVTTKTNAIQSTLANQPTYVASGINNLPVVKFLNSSSQNLVAAFDINYTTYSDLTFIMVYKRIGSAVNQCLFGQDNGNFDRFFCPVHSYLSSYGVSNGSAFTNITGVNTLNTPMVVSLTLRNGVSSGSTAYVNGATITTFTENHPDTGLTSFALGAITGTGATDFFDGYLAEFIVFTRAIKIEERQAIERYLGKKWGITVS